MVLKGWHKLKSKKITNLIWKSQRHQSEFNTQKRKTTAAAIIDTILMINKTFITTVTSIKQYKIDTMT